MYSMHIHQCNFPLQVMQRISLRLNAMLHQYPGTSCTDSVLQSTDTIELSILLQIETRCDIDPGGESMRIIGNQGRYLLYLDPNIPTPGFVFMLHTDQHRDPKTCKKLPMVFMCNTTTDKGEKGNHIDDTNDTTGPGGGGTRTLLASIQNTKTCNSTILRMMQPFFSGTPSLHVDKTPISTSDGTSLVVYVNGKNGTRDSLPIVTDGLRSAQYALRHNGFVGADVVIAQNWEYTIRLILQDGVFNLCLYHTEDIFAHTPDIQEPVALITLSHTFHPYDCVIEKINDTISDGKHSRRVTGMLAVVQELLRRNVVAVPIRSMGSNRYGYMYTDMHPTDITNVLHSMCLISDNSHITRTLNRKHKAVVVRHVDSTLLFGGTFPSTAMSSDAPTNPVGVNFRIRYSNALHYAVAHQNRVVTGLLNHGFGVDLQEVSIAIRSGVSFCHSCAYDEEPTEVHRDVYAHMINGSDFPAKFNAAVKRILTESAVAVSSSTHAVSWSKVRHNFHVQQNFHAQKEHANPVLIECHVTKSGVVLFRRSVDICSGSTRNANKGFVGAVYIVPSLLVDTGFDGDEHPSMLTVAATPSAVRPPHPLISITTQLASQVPQSPSALLRNATETLFHINAMCIHNNDSNADKSVPAQQLYDTNAKHHTMLRKAWLHTNMCKASRLCRGVQNSDFYGIYAHLSNLAALPMHSANYWGTMPYV